MTTATSTTVPISFIHGLFGRIAPASEQRERWLNQVGIAPELLNEANARVTTDQFANLYQLLAREIDDETPGMFSRPMRGGTLKYLCLAMMDSTNLHAALYRFSRFMRILLDDIEFEVARQDELIRIMLTTHTPTARENIFAQEMMLKLVHGIASWLAGRKIPLARVDFVYAPPPHAAEYVFLYPGPHHFECPATALYFQLDDLAGPVRQDKRSIGEFVMRAPGNWMFVSFAERIVSHRVREYLERNLDRPVTVESAARAMHVSLRTLSRRLREEGNSFQAIKDQLRRDIAVQRLTKTNLPISVIGHQLGFDDPTTFHRAFRKWTGSTPRTYRSRPS